MIPAGWKIKRLNEPPFRGIELSYQPEGRPLYRTTVYEHARNPENMLYMLAAALLDGDGVPVASPTQENEDAN